MTFTQKICPWASMCVTLALLGGATTVYSTPQPTHISVAFDHHSNAPFSEMCTPEFAHSEAAVAVCCSLDDTSCSTPNETNIVDVSYETAEQTCAKAGMKVCGIEAAYKGPLCRGARHNILRATRNRETRLWTAATVEDICPSLRLECGGTIEGDLEASYLVPQAVGLGAAMPVVLDFGQDSQFSEQYLNVRLSTCFEETDFDPIVYLTSLTGAQRLKGGVSFKEERAIFRYPAQLQENATCGCKGRLASREYAINVRHKDAFLFQNLYAAVVQGVVAHEGHFKLSLECSRTLYIGTGETQLIEGDVLSQYWWIGYSRSDTIAIAEINFDATAKFPYFDTEIRQTDESSPARVFITELRVDMQDPLYYPELKYFTAKLQACYKGSNATDPTRYRAEDALFLFDNNPGVVHYVARAAGAPDVRVNKITGEQTAVCTSLAHTLSYAPYEGIMRSTQSLFVIVKGDFSNSEELTMHTDIVWTVEKPLVPEDAVTPRLD